MTYSMRVIVSVTLVSATLLTVSLDGQRKQAAPPPALSTFDVMEKSIDELQRAMTERKLTARQLVDIYLARIDAYDQRGPALNAVMFVNPRAREAADALDAERAKQGPRGPLHGIPILVKDNYETIEMPTTAGSIALATMHPARDAFQVQRLKAAGAIILAKTTMHELASGILTVGSGFGQTKNPYDLSRNPGGSSGGTGAAVAANFAAAGMGSDTCGSIRNPASQNNLVGLRGTQGLSSRGGIVPLSTTQDIGGPIARSIEDLAILLDATVGPDTGDPSTSVAAGHIPASYRVGLKSDALKDARVGVIRSLFGSAPEDQEVTSIVNRALETMRKAGADVSDAVVPGLEDLLRNSSMINADFKFDFAEYLATVENPPVKSLGEILDRGLYHAALESTFRTRNAVETRENEASRRARIKRVAIRQAVEAVMRENKYAALVYPTLRRRPARIGDPQGGSNCQLSAHSGLPALAVPAGFTPDGVPVGMELIGEAFSEQALLSLGLGVEKALNLRRPPFSTPALINGKAPQPVAVTLNLEQLRGTLTLTYDETASRLDYALRADPAAARRIGAIWIHAGSVQKPGASRYRLFPGQEPTGTLTLTAADREDLRKGNWLVRVYLTGQAGSVIDVPIAKSGAR
jgi:Asp-tRNA(Asn)/Glu-tRNA(Gln) amidotransferase A subunit family amidase